MYSTPCRTPSLRQRSIKMRLKSDSQGSQTILQAPIKSSRKQRIPDESTESLKQILQIQSNPGMSEEVLFKSRNYI